MKVNKHFISQIIKQEIKSILYEEEDVEKRFNALKRIKQMRDVVVPDPLDDLVIQLNNLFIKYRDQLMNNPTKNQKLVVNVQNILKNIAPNLQGSEILKLLDGKIDRQLLSFVSDLLKRDPNMPQGGYSLPDYEMPLELGREQGVMPYNRGQVDAFMRAPQHKGPYDNERQIDFRRKQKNLTMESNMKISKQQLKQIIKEAINEEIVNENVQLSRIKDMKDQEIIQLFVNFSKKLTNVDYTPQQVLNILSTTEMPKASPVDITKWSEPIKRDPKTGRPIPQVDNSDSEQALAPTHIRSPEKTAPGKGQK